MTTKIKTYERKEFIKNVFIMTKMQQSFMVIANPALIIL